MESGVPGASESVSKTEGGLRMGELKPCPFCGGEAKIQQTNPSLSDFPVSDGCGGFERVPSFSYDWSVVCKKCRMRGVARTDYIFRKESGEIIVAQDGRKETIDAWNRRAAK